jgi:hypothetical protein
LDIATTSISDVRVYPGEKDSTFFISYINTTASSTDTSTMEILIIRDSICKGTITINATSTTKFGLSKFPQSLGADLILNNSNNSIEILTLKDIKGTVNEDTDDYENNSIAVNSATNNKNNSNMSIKSSSTISISGGVSNIYFIDDNTFMLVMGMSNNFH